MKHFIVLILVVLVSCNKKHDATTSIENVEKEALKEGYVEAYGYIVLDFESTAIYKSVLEFQEQKTEDGIYKDAIWLEVKPTDLIKPFQGRVTGKLINERSGHRDLFPKRLTDVKIYDLSGNRILVD